MANISAKKIIRYAVMPQIMPRISALIASGFQHIPYMIALVYQAVRLLPPTHPYLDPANIGRFGVRHVIAEAANNLVISRHNIDQIVLFAVTLAGLVLVVLQIGLLVFGLLSPAVMAQVQNMPTSFKGFFVTPNPKQDLAYIMLDMVFGIPDMFKSCVSTGGDCVNVTGENVTKHTGDWVLSGMGFPFPIHYAMHQLFQFYSIGLLIVATLISMYFVVTIIAETAQSGTPFGKRFNKVWAPLRIVAAFGLLIPVGHGLNSAQYIVLYAAKFGSSFATNGWIMFNKNLNGNYLGDGTPDQLISRPNLPDIGGLLQFVFVARVCKELEYLKVKPPMKMRDIQAYLVRDPLTKPSALLVTEGLPYQKMLDFANGDSQVIIRFGVQDEKAYPRFKGNVAPICGELTFTLTDPRNSKEPVDPHDPTKGVQASQNPPDPGPEYMQKTYWDTIVADPYSMWQEQMNNMPSGDGALNMARKHGIWQPDPDVFTPTQEDLHKIADQSFLKPLNDALDEAVKLQVEKGKWQIDKNLLDKGWAGAGIWYNKVAELNGALTASVMSVPSITHYPEVMEFVAEAKKRQDQEISPATRFEPKLSGGQDVWTNRPEDLSIAKVLWESFRLWNDKLTTTPHTASTGNALGDMVNALFGTEGLYNMRKNAHVHPLAQLVGVGRSLIESSIRNIGMSVASAAGGAVGSFVDKLIGQAGSGAVSFFMSFAMMALTAGFILFYVVPFLPFIYFFFAVGGWVKAIFEAMVGTPLWALAHIRIDGNGLPGQAAMNGYFLILEIFLRPIMIVFGMLASITIFAALVSVLNQTWDLIVSNTSGFDATDKASMTSLSDYMRAPIDEFFFTVLYTIIVYLMAMSSFKLIDDIPTHVLRWMGASVQTFNDAAENPAQSFAGKAAVGGSQISQVVGGGGVQTLLQKVSTARQTMGE